MSEDEGFEPEIEEEHTTKVEIPVEERIRVNQLPFKLPSKLRDLLDGFKWAITKKNQSAVIIVDGRSGLGKSTLSFQMAAYMSKNFSLDFVYFTPEDFLEGLSKAEKGSTLVFDEAMLLSSRSALSAINRMTIQAMSMIRSKNLLIIFNVNSIFDLDRNLALSRADLLLHLYGDSLTDRGKFLAFFKGGDKVDRIKNLYLYGKKLYSYDFPRSNFNTNFSKYFVVDKDTYEIKKQEGVNKFLNGGDKSGKHTKDKIARNKAIIWMFKQGLPQTTIADNMGVSPKLVWEVINKHKIETSGLTD